MPRRVMIADDQEDMRMLMRLVFVGQGWTVISEAENGVQAVDAWESERAAGVQLVLLDQQMPGMTGIEVAERILAESPGQQIIIASAYLSDEVVERARIAGVLGCVEKAQITELPKWDLLQA